MTSRTSRPAPTDVERRTRPTGRAKGIDGRPRPRSLHQWAPEPDPGPTPTGESDLEDLLLLATLSTGVVAALVWVRRQQGDWQVRSRGFGTSAVVDEPRLRDRVLADHQPIEIDDLRQGLAGTWLVAPPWSLRWAYGAALRDPRGRVVAVLALIDRAIRSGDRGIDASVHATLRCLGRVSASAGEGRTQAAEPLRPTVARPGLDEQVLPPFGQVLPTGPEVMSPIEVARLYCVTRRTIANWVIAGRLPFFRTPTGRIRFRRSDLTGLGRDSRHRPTQAATGGPLPVARRLEEAESAGAPRRAPSGCAA
jgi:excisionase family DNA binding protein